MSPTGRALATLVVLAGVALMTVYVAIATESASPLFVLLAAAALLPVAYVVDTGTRPNRLDEPVRGEAAMLLLALVALLAGGLAFASESLPAVVVAGLAGAAAIGLVGRNWRHRASARQR